MTIHNSAKKEDIAETVLMPGDPLRAKWIAENYLSGVRLVNEVRGMFAFTGAYKNKPLTVMAHGMGIPSAGIYTWELFNFYDARRIIRVGSAGAYSGRIKTGDIIIAKESFSYSDYARDIGVEVNNHILRADGALVSLAERLAAERSLAAHTCRVFSSDTFYNKYSLSENIERSGSSEAVEMESFALYANAIKTGKRALALLTCSDSLVTGEEMSAAGRQNKLSSMVELALAMTLEL